MHPSIALWGHPRSMSTAIERSFSERGDFAVFHEPFAYVRYMNGDDGGIPHKNPDPDHPHSYDGVKDMMARAARVRPVFHKDFPYHVIRQLRADIPYLKGQINTFLIRDPQEAVASHLAIRPDVTREALGYDALLELFDIVADLTGAAPLVLNAADVVADPAATLNAYCDAIGIRFIPEALTWQASDRPEWASWKGWHEDVARSEGFARPARQHFRRDVSENPTLSALVDQCRAPYEQLDRFRLKILQEAAQ